MKNHKITTKEAKKRLRVLDKDEIRECFLKMSRHQLEKIYSRQLQIKNNLITKNQEYCNKAELVLEEILGINPS